MKKSIQDTLKYFKFFDYTPSFDELYTFLTVRTSKKALYDSLNSRLKNKFNNTGGEYNRGVKIARDKLRKIDRYLYILEKLPQIKLVGLSGSVAMLSAKRNDDIDLFVITSSNRLWTGRFICLILASLLGKRRKFGQPHAANKICLNLFFDSADLKIPIQKRSEYLAHEVLQMKPLIDRDDTYNRFLKVNNWVFKLYPNARFVAESLFFRAQNRSLRSLRYREPRKKTDSAPLFNLFDNILEATLKYLQLTLINRHRTTEYLTDTQLWFFPDDFAKKMPLQKATNVR